MRWVRLSMTLLYFCRAIRTCLNCAWVMVTIECPSCSSEVIGPHSLPFPSHFCHYPNSTFLVRWREVHTHVSAYKINSVRSLDKAFDFFVLLVPTWQP